jgi:hypothetical protein
MTKAGQCEQVRRSKVIEPGPSAGTPFPRMVFKNSCGSRGVADRAKAQSAMTTPEAIAPNRRPRRSQVMNDVLAGSTWIRRTPRSAASLHSSRGASAASCCWPACPHLGATRVRGEMTATSVRNAWSVSR